MRVVALGLVAACIGCISSDGAADDGGTKPDARAGGSASFTWDDDGVARRAGAVAAHRTVSSAYDQLQLIGATATGISIAITVTAFPPATLGGIYMCSPATPYLQYNLPAINMAQTCTIDITQPGVIGGAHAVGTFSAVIPVSGGGTRNLSNGKFDVAVTK